MELCFETTNAKNGQFFYRQLKSNVNTLVFADVIFNQIQFISHFNHKVFIIIIFLRFCSKFKLKYEKTKRELLLKCGQLLNPDVWNFSHRDCCTGTSSGKNNL